MAVIKHNLGHVGSLFTVQIRTCNLYNESFRLQLCQTNELAALELSRDVER